MHLLATILLLSPGFVSIRILWHNKEILRKDYFIIACDYVIYSFFIHMMTYGFMYFTYPERTVSLTPSFPAVSNILGASFVFKYSFVSLIFALVLPVFVPWLVKIWRSLEDGRKKK